MSNKWNYCYCHSTPMKPMKPMKHSCDIRCEIPYCCDRPYRLDVVVMLMVKKLIKQTNNKDTKGHNHTRSGEYEANQAMKHDFGLLVCYDVCCGDDCECSDVDVHLSV
eukprot:461189_1